MLWAQQVYKHVLWRKNNIVIVNQNMWIERVFLLLGCFCCFFMGRNIQWNHNFRQTNTKRNHFPRFDTFHMFKGYSVEFPLKTQELGFTFYIASGNVFNNFFQNLHFMHIVFNWFSGTLMPRCHDTNRWKTHYCLLQPAQSMCHVTCILYVCPCAHASRARNFSPKHFSTAPPVVKNSRVYL